MPFLFFQRIFPHQRSNLCLLYWQVASLPLNHQGSPYLCLFILIIWASLVAQMIKCLPAMWETWVWSLGWEDPLEKEMATHSSTLAWKIPWMEETGRLQPMGSQRVRQDWGTSLSFFILIIMGFPHGSVVKKLPANAGDSGLIPGSGRSPGGGNGNPLQYSHLGNPRDRGTW